MTWSLAGRVLPEVRASAGAVGRSAFQGRLPEQEYIDLVKQAGFVDVRCAAAAVAGWPPASQFTRYRYPPKNSKRRSAF